MKITAENLREHMQTHTKGNSWWMNDARGIPLCRVCTECQEAACATYKPAVTGRGADRYEDVVEEQIEEDY